MTLDEIKVAYTRKLPFTCGDPNLARTSLPLCATFFPLGFPVQIHTNSPEVLECAAESWSDYPHLFQRDPLEIRVLVHGSATIECPPAPNFRAQGHLLINVADPEHYSVLDLNQHYAFISISPAALRHRGYFRYYFLEAAALGTISNRHTTAIHAACVELEGKGVLLCGDSGAGKSTLAYACSQAGWTYITDDASFLVHGRTDRLVVGNFRQARFRPSATSLFPALAGREIMSRAKSGKPSIEFPTATDPTIKRAPVSHIHHLVFLNRKSVTRPALTRFPREIARHYIVQTSSWLPSVDNTSLIDGLLRIQPLELRYDDLSLAINRLQDLVRNGRRL